MSDHTPRTIAPEECEDGLRGLEDGQVRITSVGGEARVFVKCSHVDNGACAECLLPLLDGFYRMAEDLARLKRSLRRLAGVAAPVASPSKKG